MIPAHEVAGEGQPAVLIPGTFSDRKAWLKQVGALSPRFRVVLLDPRGVGETPDPGLPFTPDDLAGDVLALLDHLGIERAHLVGHSLGATVALTVAGRWPHRVRRVVAAAPVLYMDAYLTTMLDHWEALASSSVGDHDLHRAVALDAFGRETFARLVPAVVREMDRHPIPRATMLRYVDCDRSGDLRPLAGRIEAPVLVICGAEDALSGPGQARMVAASIAGARLEILEGAGHSPQIEAPPAFNRLVSAFLAD